MCGVFALPQRGQLLRAGADNFQLLARRLRVFDFDFFLLGTATRLLRHDVLEQNLCSSMGEWRLSALAPVSSTSSLFEPEVFQRRPSVVSVLDDAIAAVSVSIGAAYSTDPLAFLSTQHGVGDVDHDDFANRGHKVDVVGFNPRYVGFVKNAERRCSRHKPLVESHFADTIDRTKTSPALAIPIRNNRADDLDAVGRRCCAQIHYERRKNCCLRGAECTAQLFVGDVEGDRSFGAGLA